MIGISVNARKKTPKMLREANMPNSISIALVVSIKVANPDAVVKFVRNIALPIL